MTSEKLLGYLSFINDRYVEMIDPCVQSSGKKTPYKAIAAIAASVCVIVGCVLLFNYLGRVNQNDFIIENGILISYCGDETEIVLPEGIKTITAKSFENSKNAHSITSIHLSSDVETIEKDTFSDLRSLKNVTVSADNPYYTSVEGILGKTDGAVYFGFVDSYVDALAFAESIEAMQENTENFGKITDIVIGKGVVQICFSEDKEAVTCKAVSVSAYGHQKNFEPPLQLYGNQLIYIYQTEKEFVFSRVVNGFGENWIFTSDGLYIVDNNHDGEIDYQSAEWYNESCYAFETREDGKLGYIRMPRKYLQSQVLFEQIRYCVASDEFCKEVGYVEFVGGNIRYIPEQKYTVSQVYDINVIYEEWHSYAQTMDEQYFEINGIPKTDSLDELLEYNSRIYERAE